MAERVYIAWNIPNWLTVIGMLIVFYLVVTLIMQFVLGKGGSAPSFGGSASGVQPGGYIGASLLYGGASAGVSPLS